MKLPLANCKSYLLVALSLVMCSRAFAAGIGDHPDHQVSWQVTPVEQLREGGSATESANHWQASKRHGELDQAINAYQAAIAANPMRAELYNNLACAYLAKGDLDQALK
ncbi:MAG TPA: tetratricopeptide repeat protein, partial [Candidatus Obscuribacterales bacterium]